VIVTTAFDALMVLMVVLFIVMVLRIVYLKL